MHAVEASPTSMEHKQRWQAAASSSIELRIGVSASGQCLACFYECESVAYGYEQVGHMFVESTCFVFQRPSEKRRSRSGTCTAVRHSALCGGALSRRASLDATAGASRTESWATLVLICDLS